MSYSTNYHDYIVSKYHLWPIQQTCQIHCSFPTHVTFASKTGKNNDSTEVEQLGKTERFVWSQHESHIGISNLHQTLIQRSGGSPRIHHLRGKVPKNSFWRTFLLPQKAIRNRPSKTAQGANRHETPTRFTTTKRLITVTRRDARLDRKSCASQILAPKQWQRRIPILLMIGKLGV